MDKFKQCLIGASFDVISLSLASWTGCTPYAAVISSELCYIFDTMAMLRTTQNKWKSSRNSPVLWGPKVGDLVSNLHLSSPVWTWTMSAIWDPLGWVRDVSIFVEIRKVSALSVSLYHLCHVYEKGKDSVWRRTISDGGVSSSSVFCAATWKIHTFTNSNWSCYHWSSRPRTGGSSRCSRCSRSPVSCSWLCLLECIILFVHPGQWLG